MYHLRFGKFSIYQAGVRCLRQNFFSVDTVTYWQTIQCFCCLCIITKCIETNSTSGFFAFSVFGLLEAARRRIAAALARKELKPGCYEVNSVRGLAACGLRTAHRLTHGNCFAAIGRLGLR
jgi:hypothetical protein